MTAESLCACECSGRVSYSRLQAEPPHNFACNSGSAADGTAVTRMGLDNLKWRTDSTPHPLDQLTIDEVNSARKVVLDARAPTPVVIRDITLREPKKESLVPFLDAEHAGATEAELDAMRPPRIGQVLYDLISPTKEHSFCESLVNLTDMIEESMVEVDKKIHAPLSTDEILRFPDIAMASELFQEELRKLDLPENTVIVIDPWMYGGCGEESPRYMQGLVYARDPATNNPDSNHYAFPLPLIPVVDMQTNELVRVDWLATGGTEDGMERGTGPKNALDHCKPSEYIPELVEGGLRTDLKPLNVVQPLGASFEVNGHQIKWQKWSFRVGFNPREGATIHDVRYDGRSIFYRLSFSEMSVPYGDPRSPFHRKQAFDFGDGGAGRASNNLQLGCDCLGLIKYFDAVMSNPAGVAQVYPNVVCLHEQDNGIGWKHSNYRTGRAVVTRNRVLVVQFIITLANYEYIFSYNFDQAGGISIETRATGVVSTVPIDPGKVSPWGNVVSPGVLAQNHQHLFCVRIDPAIDGQKNTIIQEESHPLPWTPEENPMGNGYAIHRKVFETSCFADAAPQNNRIFKIVNRAVKNPMSGRPVGYKLTPSPTQLILAHPGSLMANRATYATHHIWITKFRDWEFWAAGRWTNQSGLEVGGVGDMVKREEPVADEDVVLWHSFGLTHNPRVEDFPVMPVETHAIALKPSDFFHRNPAIDVPSQQNLASMLYENSPSVLGNSLDQNCCSSKKKDFPKKQKNVVVVVTTASSASGATSVTTTATAKA